MTETIFSPSFGNRPSYLVGRGSVISTFISGLEQEPGNRDRAMLMLGQRGSGKTVLLWELADRARKLGFVVATPTVASEDMLERIVEKIQEAGEPYANKHRLPKLAGGSLSVFGFSAGLEFTRDVQETKSFQFKLTQPARKLTEQGHGILILIDKLQANSPEIRQLVTAYQELVGERLNVALVMAGLPEAVSATLNDRVLTFFSTAHARSRLNRFQSEMSMHIISGLSKSSTLIFQATFASAPLTRPKVRPICCNLLAITSPIVARPENA